MFKIKIVQGAAIHQPLQARTKIGPATDLLSTDTFTAKLWLGGNTPLLFAPTITWLSYDMVVMIITAAQSTLLNYGVTYPVEIYRTANADPECIGIGSVTCIATPR